jgi:hypothetical protein
MAVEETKGRREDRGQWKVQGAVEGAEGYCKIKGGMIGLSKTRN